jgi:hypothetical protein
MSHSTHGLKIKEREASSMHCHSLLSSGDGIQEPCKFRDTSRAQDRVVRTSWSV